MTVSLRLQQHLDLIEQYFCFDIVLIIKQLLFILVYLYITNILKK